MTTPIPIPKKREVSEIRLQMYQSINNVIFTPKLFGLFTLPDTDLDPNPCIKSVPKMGTVVIGDPSPDKDPKSSLSNVNMFCMVQCGHQVFNRSPSRNLNPYLAM